MKRSLKIISAHADILVRQLGKVAVVSYVPRARKLLLILATARTHLTLPLEALASALLAHFKFLKERASLLHLQRQ